MNSTGNISDLIVHLANEHPELDAIIHPEHITFGKFFDIIEELEKGLRSQQIKKGSRVLLLIKPGPEMVAICFALLRIGAVLVMIDPGMGHRAMAKALKKIRIDVFIGEPRAHMLRLFYNSIFKKIKIFISTGRFQFPFNTKCLHQLNSDSSVISYSEKINADDEVAIFYTSGSTGLSKAVLYRNYMLHAQIHILKTRFGYRVHEIDCCTFPLFSLLVMCLGLSVVFADMDMTRPGTLNPQKLIDNINMFHCGHMFCSPMVLRKLVEYSSGKNIEMPSLKQVMVAGAPVHESMLAGFYAMLDEKALIYTPFGSTEALTITCAEYRELLSAYQAKPTEREGYCVGRPIEDVQLLIIQIDDGEIATIEDVAIAPFNKVGEIIVKGPNVTQEYLGMKYRRFQKIKDKIEDAYWHRTGDLGRQDKDGMVWFYGRKSQRVVTEDKTYFTVVVESVFNAHPDVERSALIGIDVSGEKFNKPVVCIELKEKGEKNRNKRIKEDLISIAKRGRMNIYDFEFISKFPVDPRHNAKIYREKLAEWVKERY